MNNKTIPNNNGGILEFGYQFFAVLVMWQDLNNIIKLMTYAIYGTPNYPCIQNM